MLRRFNRYILFETFKLFIVAILAVTTLIVMGWVVERAVAEGIRGPAIIKLIPYILPMSLQFSLPTTLLFAVASVYGRMAADNEVIAVKGSGISPVQIMKPTFFMALVLSPIGVWLTDLAASWGAPGMTQVIIHSIKEVSYNALKNQKYYAQKGFSIIVSDVEDHWLIRPVITLHSPNGGEPQVITAERAQLSLDAASNSLKIELVDYQVDIGTTQLIDGSRREFNLPLERTTRKGKITDTPATIALSRMSQEVKLERQKLRTIEDSLMSHVSLATAFGRADMFADATANTGRGKRMESQNRLRRLQLEPWRRWALGFSCFFFVWMGVPLAIYMKTADYWMTFGACFIPILLIYFPLFGLGLEQAKSGEWPAYSVWLGNAVLFFVGLWLIRIVYKS